jgi:hypothetical protein
MKTFWIDLCQFVVFVPHNLQDPKMNSCSKLVEQTKNQTEQKK